MKIIAVIPTRGVVVTECINSVIEELAARGDEWGIVFTSGLPIPDCFNKPVQKALDDGADYVWLVEEDVIVPRGGLQRLIDEQADIAAIDVPSRHVEGLTQIGQYKDVVYWVHTGCTLIKRSALNVIPQPWFEVMYQYDFKMEAEEVLFTERKLDTPVDYGGQDIRFSRKAIAEGLSIKAVKGILCTHVKVEYDAERKNCHKITKLDVITRDNAFRP